MKIRVIFFLLGAILGAGLCALILTSKSRSELATALAAEREEKTNVLAELQAELDSERERTRDARADSDRLAARVQELNKQVAAKPAAEPAKKKTGFAALFGGDGTNGMSEGFSGMIKSAIEQQLEGQISGLKLKLKLSPEQELAVREIMSADMKRGTEMAQKLFSGEMTEEEVKNMAKNEKPESQEERIRALLTPEQQTAYDEYQKEEKQRMARLVANSELMQMQGLLHLDEQQQDKVFGVLAESAQTQMSGAAGLDFQQLVDRKVEAMRGVLTAEQFEEYKKFQDQQKKMLESFMPKGATNANVRPIVIKANP